jgi:hypothetical protein
VRDVQAARGTALSQAPTTQRPKRTALLAAVAAAVLRARRRSRRSGSWPSSRAGAVELLGGQLSSGVPQPGAAFSFAEGATLLFTAVAVVVIVVIVRVSRGCAARLGAQPRAAARAARAATSSTACCAAPGPGPRRRRRLHRLPGVAELQRRRQRHRRRAGCWPCCCPSAGIEVDGDAGRDSRRMMDG